MIDNVCQCQSGFEGNNCQCDTSKKPKQTTDEECKGIGYECQADGSWAPMTNPKSCQDIYNMNGGTEASWKNKCGTGPNGLCSNVDPNYDWSLSCGNPQDGTKLWGCDKLCSKIPQKGDCSTCNGINGDINTTCICDSTTDPAYTWQCVRDISSVCPSTVPKGLCIGSDGVHSDPICITCGTNGGYTWQCPGAPENELCVKSQFNLQQINTNTTNPPTKPVSWYWDSQQSQQPVFPTINNDVCDQRVNSKYSPYSILSDQAGNEYNSVGSSPGWVTGLSSLQPGADKSTLPFYINDVDDKNVIVYNTIQSKYNCANGTKSTPGICLDGSTADPVTSLCHDKNPPYSVPQQCIGSSVTSINTDNIVYAIEGTQGEYGNLVFNNNTGCMKLPSDFCSGNGTFNQYCFEPSTDNSPAKLVLCDRSNKTHYRDDGGYCVCNPLENADKTPFIDPTGKTTKLDRKYVPI
jgi:hypothetical protein